MKSDILIELEVETMAEIMFKIFSKGLNLDLEHLPFNEFSLKVVPKKSFIESEKARIYKSRPDIFSKLSKAEAIKVLDKVTKDTCDQNIVKVKIVDKDIFVESKRLDFIMRADTYILNNNTNIQIDIENFDKENKWLSFLDISKGGDGKIEKIDDFTEDLSEYLKETRLDILSMLAYLQLPSSISNTKVDSKVVLNDKPKKKKSNKKNNKTYIYKKRYKVELDDIEKVIALDKDYIKRAYERKTAQWQAKGHWRTYSNGKKVWIKPTIKRSKTSAKENLSLATREYKISRADL